jgi:subtilase family serine protease
MSRSAKVYVCLLCTIVIFSSLSYGVTPDRISGAIDATQMVPIQGNVHGLARAGSDLGRADGTRVIEGVSLNFRLSAAQQQDLNQFLAQLGDRTSPNYHKYLKIPQYAARFGMSQNDVDKVVAWLQSQGFTNIKVAPTRNKISFDGTVAQIESLFAFEMHNYLVDGVVHFANATNPSVPAALAGTVQYVGHLSNFPPKPRVKVKPNLTSYVSGNHFVTPPDFATIYDLNALYSAGATGSNQKIAIVGQSTVSTTDLNNFRSASMLPASTVTMTLVGGVATRCSGDEGESDLDIEWSGGVAKNAQIIFLYAGVDTGLTCTTRDNSVWDALEDALTGTTSGASGSPVAPFVSTSYGYCESGLGVAFAGQNGTLETWIQTGQALGVTLVSASGDSGAADCDPNSTDPDGTSATGGIAVDAPASIPETTGAGGTEFTGDVAGVVTGNTAAGDPPYWSGSGAGSDTVSSALEYIPETAWNDTTFNLANQGGIGASGGGASIYFTKPSWQTGVGVPADGKRDVPDIALNTSPDHDPYLLCSEDFDATSCSSGFRDSSSDFSAVGGTSAAAPTFTAILVLMNQYFGNSSATGLAPINPTLYSLYADNATSLAFHDVITGNNIVPCTNGSLDCPTTAPFQYGFNAGVGYDQVTGLGSVDGFKLAEAWAATLPGFTMSATAVTPTSVAAGNSVTSTVTIAPQNGFTGTVTLACSGQPTGATCSFSPTTVAGSGTTQLTIATAANMSAATTTVTVTGTSGTKTSTATVSLAVSATTETFTLTSNLTGGTLTVTPGANAPVSLTVASSTGFITTSGGNSTTNLALTYSCTGMPSEASCTFSPSQSTTSTAVTVNFVTTPATTKLERPLDRGTRMFYAALLPGLMGIVFTFGSRKRSLRGMRLLGLIVVVGFSTMWMSSCGGSSGGSVGKNPGTPAGTYSVTINATTGGSAPISQTLAVSLVVN